MYVVYNIQACICGVSIIIESKPEQMYSIIADGEQV